MKFTFEGKYKSITPFIWQDVPDFCIITGPNGVGKSQLLYLIFGSIASIEQLYAATPRIPRSQRHKVEIEGLNIRSKDDIVYRASSWTFQGIETMNIGKLQELTRSIWEIFSRYKVGPFDEGAVELFDDIIARSGKDKALITEEEFYKLIPQYWTTNIQEMFNQMTNNSFSKIFYDYYLKKAEMTSQNMSVAAFEEKFGTPPWVVLNEIIKETKLPFEVSDPSSLPLFGNFRFLVKNIETGDLIEFQDLSSGEQILFSICFWLYNAKEIKKFPKLILLDEPDAHLHPSMSRMLIDAINNVIVKKHNVKVIMSTHSPSTVAFAPPGSLVEMNRTEPRFTKSSKNKIINNLTSGLITVGRGTKFVLVEDEIDSTFYSLINTELSRHDKINAGIPIVFIPANKNNGVKNEGGGGKAEVRKWVDKLRNAEFQNIIQGIIDKDYGNEASQGIHVLKRYSIENYLLDPYIVYALLLDNEIAPTLSGIDLKIGQEYKICTLEESKLQLIADNIHSSVEPLLTGLLPADMDKRTVKVFTNYNISYPAWLFTKRGKDLLNLYATVYSPRVVNIGNLIKMFKKIMIIPDDLVSLMKDIQLNSTANTSDSNF